MSRREAALASSAVTPIFWSALLRVGRGQSGRRDGEGLTAATTAGPARRAI